MWDLLFWFVEPLAGLVGFLFAADDRPAARRLALGCGLLVALPAVAIALYLCLGH